MTDSIVSSYSALDEQIETERARIEELYESIKAQVKVHQQQIEALHEEQTLLAMEVFEEKGLAAFHDVDTARMLYSAMWMTGNGNRVLADTVRALFKDVEAPCLVGSLEGTFTLEENNYSGPVVSAVKLGVRSDATEEDIAATVQVLEPILTVQLEIALAAGREDLPVEVSEHTLSEYGSYSVRGTAEGYQLVKRTYGLREELTSVLPLAELMAQMKTLCPKDNPHPESDEDRWAGNW
jgi:hypothetical protein